MSQPLDGVAQSTDEFDDHVAENVLRASGVQDFVRTMSHAFPSVDVLVAAPMALSILGQLAIVATRTDLKLVKPENGFKHIHHPDSFRATITQLVDSGVLALRQSYINFDEINKRCASVGPSVNNIVQLLAGHKGNTPQQNDKAIERHLPHQMEFLSKTIDTCLAKTKETDQKFADLLALLMEIQQSCHATRDKNQSKIDEANRHQQHLKSEQEAAQEMKNIRETELQEARQHFKNAQETFNAVTTENSKPVGGRELTQVALLGALDVIETVANVLILALLNFVACLHSSTLKTSTSQLEPGPSVNLSDFNDCGYQRASSLRKVAEDLAVLLIAGPDGNLDWNTIRSSSGGCKDIKFRLQEEITMLQVNDRQASQATNAANTLAEKGKNLTINLESIIPPVGEDVIEKLREGISAWHTEVIAFACEADVKLGSSRSNPNAFFSRPKFELNGGHVQARFQNARCSLAATQSQLNVSKEKLETSSYKLVEVNRELHTLMATIAIIDMEKHSWEDIAPVVEKAAQFLSQLKGYLHNLVHFFDQVHNLVSVEMKGAVDQFIITIKNTAAIEDKPGFEGVTLDVWTREAIRKLALSAAKIGRAVENISDMYVTLYNSNVHPGVNMLFGMEKLVSSNDREEEIAAAGKKMQDWAQGASDSIVHLVTERTPANEQGIQNYMRGLEKSLGTILPQFSYIEEIVHNVEKTQARETTRATEAPADANAV